jgi:hypothetical protein
MKKKDSEEGIQKLDFTILEKAFVVVEVILKLTVLEQLVWR